MGPIGVALTVIAISLATTSGMSSLTSHLKKRSEYYRKKAEEAKKEEEKKQNVKGKTD